MSDALHPEDTARIGQHGLPAQAALLLLALAAGLVGAGALMPSAALSPALLTAGAALGAAVLLLAGRAMRAARRRRAERRLLADVIEADFLPGFVTDAAGVVIHANRMARDSLGAGTGRALAGLYADRLAAPGTLFRRLREAALASGATEQDIAGGETRLRLSVRRAGQAALLWRIEEVAAPKRSGDVPGCLPAFSLTPAGALRAVNAPLEDLAGDAPATLEALVADPPLRPGDVHMIRTKHGPRAMRLVDLPEDAGGQAFGLLAADPGAPGWSALDLLPVPMLRLTPEGRVTDANRLAHLLLGADDLSGAVLADLVEGLGRPVDTWLSDIAEGRAAIRPEVVRACRREDEEAFLQITLRPVAGAEEPGLLAVLNDATELKTLEAQFVQSQKMQAIGQLAGGVAHDFNNLLTAISGHCDLLLLRHDSSDPDYADLVQIAQNANRAASLVGQLLAFSRKQTLQLEPIDLRDTLADMAHLLNRLVGEPIRLTLRHDPDLPPIRGDRRQLEQVLMNLVVNARDAMPEGGEISVQTELRRLATPLRRDRATVPPGEYVVITVTDQGCGIPPDQLPKIFEPFFTSKRTGEGTGLGLSTAYGIVKQSGGFIFADSAPGSGTAFTLYFPAFRAPREAPGPGAPPALPHPAEREPQTGTVLLVEDEAPVRAFAARALQIRGHEVIEAENAEQALNILSDPAVEVDVFVTDVVMPGLDGPSWVAEALEERPGVRVIFVSGYSEDSVTRHRASIPNSVFLPKPFSLVQLADTVQGQLQARAAAREEA